MTQILESLDFQKLIELLKYNPQQPLLFNTALFFGLFMAFMIIYECLRGKRVLKMVATIAFSLYFYYKSSAECCFILFGICISDYLLGLWIGNSRAGWVRRLIVMLNLTVNIGMLVYFKYFNLLAQSWANFTGGSFDTWDIILPAGISFFTFRSISYIVDLYRRDLEPERNFLNYTFFLTFFPPLLAGPVVRAKDMLPQIKQNPVATTQMVGEGLFLIMTGLIKKVIVADYISGNFVNRIFDNPSLYSGFENLMGCIGFTIQLYCDFSGYSDMAIGLALLMGYRFKENFRAPFKAQNPSEFWHRWHISLSTWLRDYVYIPLGGSRCSKFRTYLNNFLTMLIGGLWHGASWMYLLCGAYHGLLLVLHKAFRNLYTLPEPLKGSMLVKAANVAVTFCLIVIGFAIFRADSIETLQMMGTQIFNDFHASVAPQFIQSYMLIMLAIIAALLMHYSPSRWTTGLSEAYSSVSVLWQGLFLALVIFLVIQASNSELVPFFYLQY